MSNTHPSTESIGLHPLPAAPSAATPRARLAESLRRHGRPAGLAVALLAAAGSVLGLLLSEQGPAVLSGLYQLARLGWPAVALAVSLVAFFSVLRVTSAVLGAVGLLTERLRSSEQHDAQTRQAVEHIKADLENVSIVLERLVERTQPGMGPPPPVTYPPQGPQKV